MNELDDKPLQATLRNEFAVVQVSVTGRADGSVLTIREPATGSSITLDALEVEALTRADRELFRRLLLLDEPVDDADVEFADGAVPSMRTGGSDRSAPSPSELGRQ